MYCRVAGGQLVNIGVRGETISSRGGAGCVQRRA